MLLPNSPSALYDSPEATFNPTTTKNKRLISYALIVAGAATAAWCIYKATATISWSSSPSHNSHDAFFRSFAGINPEYLSELNASEYSALSDQDFRGLKAAESSRLLDLGFSGQECISPLQDALCPIPGACLPALSASSTTPPCAQWRRGYITDALPKAAERQQQSAHEQAEIGATWDQDGSFDQDLAWIPSQHPDKWQHFSTDRARSCLQGKRILFQGKSNVLQAWTRHSERLLQGTASCDTLLIV